MLNRLVLACFLLFSATLSFAFTGKDLLKECKGETKDEAENVIGTTYCMGYVTGVLDTIRIMDPDSKLICPPDAGVKVDAQVKIVIEFLEGHPDLLHNSPRVLVYKAFEKAFPCKK